MRNRAFCSPRLGLGREELLDDFFGQCQDAADLVGGCVIVCVEGSGDGDFGIGREEGGLFDFEVAPGQHFGDGVDLFVGQEDGVAEPFRFFAVGFIVAGQEIEILMGVPEHHLSLVVERVTLGEDHPPSIPIAWGHLDGAAAAEVAFGPERNFYIWDSRVAVEGMIEVDGSAPPGIGKGGVCRIDQVAVPVDIGNFVAHHVERRDFDWIVASELAEFQEFSLLAAVFLQAVGEAFQIVYALGFASAAQGMDMIAHDLVGKDDQATFGGADRTVRDGELEVFIFDEVGCRQVSRGADVPELTIPLSDIVIMPFALSFPFAKGSFVHPESLAAGGNP